MSIVEKHTHLSTGLASARDSQGSHVVAPAALPTPELFAKLNALGDSTLELEKETYRIHNQLPELNDQSLHSGSSSNQGGGSGVGDDRGWGEER